MKQIFRTSDLDVCRDGKTLVTEKLQELIDLAAQARGIALLEKGTYLTAALYLKSHMELQFEEGAVLLGTTDEEQYPVVPTRAAGIEMDWYPGILNCDGQTDVVISGPGMIDGQGEYWWNKYWGEDQKGGMREEYDAKGLRWACDYDCMRVRNLVVMGSDHVTNQGYHLLQIRLLECAYLLQQPDPCGWNQDCRMWKEQSKHRWN